MKIVLHTTNCPQCSVIESMLNKVGLEYEKNYDTEIMLELGMASAPGLSIDDAPPMLFFDALQWIRSQKKV